MSAILWFLLPGWGGKFKGSQTKIFFHHRLWDLQRNRFVIGSFVLRSMIKVTEACKVFFKLALGGPTETLECELTDTHTR
jgi:hypothetical protein